MPDVIVLYQLEQSILQKSDQRKQISHFTRYIRNRGCVSHPAAEMVAILQIQGKRRLE